MLRHIFILNLESIINHYCYFNKIPVDPPALIRKKIYMRTHGNGELKENFRMQSQSMYLLALPLLLMLRC